jgi:glutamate-1-semialdehyde aminotransferase
VSFLVRHLLQQDQTPRLEYGQKRQQSPLREILPEDARKGVCMAPSQFEARFLSITQTSQVIAETVGAVEKAIKTL